MKAQDFRQLKQVVTSLPPKQKSELEHMLQYPESIPEIVKQLENQSGECPHCKHKESQKWGTANGRQRFRCKSCHKTFNTLTGTELNHMHKLDLLDKYTETMMDSKPLRQAAKACGINLTTAFNWRHKLLKAGNALKSDVFDGIVEIDETMFKLSEKGNRNIEGRKPRKRGTDKAEKIKVVIAVDRSGHICESVMKQFKLETLKTEFLPRLNKEIVLCTDGHMNYEYLTSKANLKHVVLNSNKGERVKEKVFHIQTVNGYHSRVKKWVGHFRGVASKYLQHYLNWFRWFEMNKQTENRETMFMKDMLSHSFQQKIQT